MLVYEAERRAQPAAIDELHNRKQLLKFVFEWRAGKHQGVAAFQLFNRARCRSGPVSDSLRLVEDDQVRTQFLHVSDVFENQLVVGESEKLRGGIHRAALRQQTFDDLHRAIGEFLDLRLPLVFHRGRRNHQHSLDSPPLTQKFGRGQCLNRFPKPHIVCQNRAPATSSKQSAADLIGQELRF